jgi:anti-anti-sigma regulatory factor
MFIPHAAVPVLPFPDTVLSEEGARAVARSARQAGWPEVALDLGRVSRPTAAGLGRLVALHARLRAAGGGLTLWNVRGPVYEA